MFGWKQHLSLPAPLYTKNLDCLVGGFTPGLDIHLEMLGGKFHFKAPSPSSCLSPNSTSKKARQTVPLPRESQDHSHRLFKLPPENEHVVSPFPSPVDILVLLSPLCVFSGATQECWHPLNLGIF